MDRGGQQQGEQGGGQQHAGDRHVPPSHEGKDRDRRADGDADLRQVLAEEGLQLLHAVDHRQHHAAGALAGEPGRAEGDDAVEQAGTQIGLHTGGGGVGDDGAGVVQPRPQQDRRGGGQQQRQLRREAGTGEHAGEEKTDEHEAGDAGRERQQAERHARGDAPAQALRHPPEPPIEIHAYNPAFSRLQLTRPRRRWELFSRGRSGMPRLEKLPPRHYIEGQ